MAKILVVDDDAMNLRLAATALEQGGHEVLRAQDAAEGFDGFIERPFHYDHFLTVLNGVLGKP